MFLDLCTSLSKAIFQSFGSVFFLLLLFLLFFNEVPKAAGGVSIFPILSTYVSTYQFFSRVGKKRNLSAILNQLKRTVFVVRRPKNKQQKTMFSHDLIVLSVTKRSTIQRDYFKNNFSANLL